MTFDATKPLPAGAKIRADEAREHSLSVGETAVLRPNGSNWQVTTELLPNVEHVHCDTAVGFVEALSPRGPYFRKADPNQRWLFRGHGDDTYRLIPVVLRPEKSELVRRLGRQKQPLARNRHQVAAELVIVRDFLLSADTCGLPLPEDSQDMRSYLEYEWELWDEGGRPERLNISSSYKTQSRPWPPEEFFSLIALAQHYGLPTRLLDWSFSSFTAAYFAATDAVDLSDTGGATLKSKRLSVWALDGTPLVDGHFFYAHQSQPGVRVYLVSVPQSSNPNLNAQRGVFTLATLGELQPDAMVDRTPLDSLDLADFSPTARLNFIHFTVPTSEACRILWLLAKEGITKGRLFPGYTGVALGLKERLLWASPFEQDDPMEDEGLSGKV